MGAHNILLPRAGVRGAPPRGTRAQQERKGQRHGDPRAQGGSFRHDAHILLFPVQPQTSSTCRQRLGYYLTGVALGFAILGFFWLSKQQAQRAQQASQAAAPAAPAAPPAPK